MSMLTIRPITIHDLSALQSLGKTTFFETFAPHNSEANMQHYLATGFELDKLEKELSCKNSFFYFAEWNGELAGYLKLNIGDAQTEMQDPFSLEVERIYVLQAFQANKIGQALFNKALEFAKEKLKQYVWLGVWEKNEKAIGFYQKNGFVVFDQHEFKLGNEVQTDLMMKLTL